MGALCATACSSLDGRPASNDAATEAPAADDARGDVTFGTLSSTPDRSLSRAWPNSVTAASVRLDEEHRFILFAGASNDAERDLSLTRLTATGADARFASADTLGFSRAPARRGTARLQAVPRAASVDRQGRIVTVGSGAADSVRSGVAARWLPDGALDMSFGTGGVSVIAAPSDAVTRQLLWRALVIDDDGSLLVAGSDEIPYNVSTVGMYARITASGALDESFGVRYDRRFAGFSAMLRDGDGYVLAGSAVRGGAPTLLYLDASGRPRADVGDAGAVAHTSEMASPMIVRAMLRDVDGGIVVAGGTGTGGASEWTQTPLRLVRYTATRAPDLAWADGGVLRAFTTAWWNFEMCHAGGLIPWTRGSFLVVGQEGYGFRVFRVLRGGRVDAAFGENGSLFAQPPGFQYVFEMLPDERGGLWVFYRASMEHAVAATHFPPV